MSQPYVGEVRSVGFNFAPVGYLQCDGSLQPISQYEVLYTLLGTTYGGDGVNTFGLPDLRGRLVVHQGTGQGLTPRVLGQKSGTEGVTLLTANLPSHTHAANATTTAGNASSPSGALLAACVDVTTPATTITQYLPNTATLNLLVIDPSTVQPMGNSLPHENRMPFLAVTYIIAYAGIFPSQN
jgi:microcystin-dependent protein